MTTPPEAINFTNARESLSKREKVITTHKSPDLDATVSTWLIKRFLPGWDTAGIEFVDTGMKYEDDMPSYEISPGEFTRAIIQRNGKDHIFLDTGYSAFDHHQDQFVDRRTSAARLAFQFIRGNGVRLPYDSENAIKQIVRYTVDEDNFQHLFWENLQPFDHTVTLYQTLFGLHTVYSDDREYMQRAMVLLDGLHSSLSGNEVSTDFSFWHPHVDQNSLEAYQRINEYLHSPKPEHDHFSLKHIIGGLHAVSKTDADFENLASKVLDGMVQITRDEVIPAEHAVEHGQTFITLSGKRAIELEDMSLVAERLAYLDGNDIVLQSLHTNGEKVYRRIGLKPVRTGELSDSQFNLHNIKDKVLQMDDSVKLSQEENHEDVWFFHPSGFLATNSPIHRERIPSSLTNEQLQDIISTNL